MTKWVRPLLSRRWRWVTLGVIVGIGVMIGLGIWQLDRREQRKAYNATLAAQLAQPPAPVTGQEDAAALEAMQDRQVWAEGQYDTAHQFLILLQPWEGRTGAYLVTPLMLDESTAILVNRGWIPQEEQETASQYDVTGSTIVEGYVARSEVPRYGTRDLTSTTFNPEQYRIDIEVLQAQLPYELLPVYILQAPTEGAQVLPYRTAPEIDLSEGPHLSYALQWFSFSLLLGGGYLYFVQQQEKKTVGNAA